MVTLHDVRSVNWGAKHLWDIKFEDQTFHKSKLGTPFDKWFPAAEVELTEASLDVFTADFYARDYQVPYQTHQFELRVTFYDDEKFTLYKWLRDWIKLDINNLDQQDFYVTRLEEACKIVYVSKLNSRRAVTETRKLLVFPKQSLAWEGTSAPDAQQYTVQFVVAGEIT